MITFGITSVDQTGVECVLANPLPSTPDLGSLVGTPVQFCRRVVGKVARLYRDATGPWVCKLALDDMPTLRLSATGCLTAVTVGNGAVEMTDRAQDLGKSFEYTGPDGFRLAKSFRGLSEFERDQALLKQHVAKLPVALRRNESFAELLVKGTDMAPKNWRKVGGPVRDSRSTWPSATLQIGVARVQLPNRNGRA